MRLSLIVAMDCHGLIGGGDRMPWYIPSDLARFRRITIGKPIIMGSKTYRSLGRPLPSRLNIVISRNPELTVDGCVVVRSMGEARDEAARYLAEKGDEEAVVIGGSVIFREFLNEITTAYISVVEGQFHGDVYFPVAEFAATRWTLVEPVAWNRPDDRDWYGHHFFVVRRTDPTDPAVIDFDLRRWLLAP